MALYKVPALDDARTLDRRLSVVHCRAGRHGVRLHATHCAALARLKATSAQVQRGGPILESQSLRKGCPEGDGKDGGDGEVDCV